MVYQKRWNRQRPYQWKNTCMGCNERCEKMYIDNYFMGNKK